MSAFSYSVRYKLVDNIRTLYNRRKVLSRLLLTHEEYIDTFVPAEARQLFRDVMPYHDNSGYLRGKIDLRPFGGEQGQLWLRGDRKACPPLVKDLTAQPDAPADVVERIKSWIENGGDAHRDFGRVTSVFTYLNDNYSRAALRHYWPSIMVLCDQNDETKYLVQELQTMRPPVNLKPLPPGLVQACRKTASTVSTAQLIPTDVSGAEIEEVSIEAVCGQQYREDGLGEFFGLS